ncbi:MAG: hypothetical protein H6716_10945 [Polyangiaceae bacterium]|nr:hypothetical protein [Polyangiaceae bacterium]
MHRILFCLFGSFSLVACSKSIDPAYLKAYQERADGICACVAAQPKLPTKTIDGAETYDTEPAKKIVQATSDCIRKFPGESSVKTPNGDPPGIYEESLKEADRKQLQAENARATACEEAHLKQRRDVF